jgi:hypothetical protein
MNKCKDCGKKTKGFGIRCYACANKLKAQLYPRPKKNKIDMKKYHKEYYQKNKEKYKIYYQTHKEQHSKSVKKWYDNHKQQRVEAARIWRKNHRKQINEQHKKRLKKDINFKLKCYLRSRIYNVLKGNYKSKRTLELLDCSLKFFKQYLESRFKQGMTWENYGKWHIDHIRPCASFDLSKAEEQAKCFNYTNLQPLWAKENLSKKDK